jgi:hypothetical protein
MKLAILLIELMLSLTIFGAKNEIMLKIQSDNLDLTDELKELTKVEVNKFIKKYNYKLLDEKLQNKIMNRESKECKSEECILKVAKSLSIKKIIIVNINLNEVDNRLKFAFYLLNMETKKEYSLLDNYDTKLNSKEKFVSFLYNKLDELFKHDLKETKLNVRKFKKQDKKYQNKSISSNRKVKGIRETKKLGFSGSLGGSTIYGFTISYFISESIDLELSLVGGFLPIVIGLRKYFTSKTNFSPYIALHATIIAVYMSLGIEYRWNNGVSFSVEAGPIAIKDSFLTNGDVKVLPWGGIKLGYHF